MIRVLKRERRVFHHPLSPSVRVPVKFSSGLLGDKIPAMVKLELDGKVGIGFC
ncbi:MAG: hypothetical protein GF353_06270, partial [Candidatus Lokiarchaeota archaeon]|nr:hypothetical protein [Candidatus Lokiarchaeota archaeon]